MGGFSAGRPNSIGIREHPPIRQRAGVPLAVLAIAALIASCAGPAPTQAPLMSGTPYPSTPAASPGGSTTPSVPSPVPQDWTKLTLAEGGPVADLQPTRSGRAGVAVDTAFKLTSLDGRKPSDLAARLVADPALTFKVSSVDGATAIVSPSAPMRTSTLYRISLTRSDGSAEAVWAAQTAGPLHVVETIPGNEATGVPLDTGIEITFDQAGVSATDVASHFTISPAAKGRFEVAGRTAVFVPTTPLGKSRVYTVTVTHGLPLAGAGQVLATDEVVRFETTGTAPSAISVLFARSFVEATSREQAAITVYVDLPEAGKAPASIPVTVHQLPGMTAAIDAWNTIRTAPTWTRLSTTMPVSTTDLTQVAEATVPLHNGNDYVAWIQLPRRLALGWYLVTETWGGVPRQAVLQVTDIASFTMLTTTRSAVWVNDLATGDAAAGATVALGGHDLGATDDRGLLVATTPRAAVTGEDPWTDTMAVIRYRSQTAFQPVYLNRYCQYCGEDSVTDGWWHLFTSDRGQYRSTDTITAWGVLRNRDTGKVPASVTVTLQPDWSSEPTPTPIATVKATPDGSGAFSISMALKGLPVGYYRLLLWTGTKQVGELWMRVATIVKPAYQLSVTTDRHAVISGQSVTASVDASFFEGTPVAGTGLSLSSDSVEATTSATTDTLGHASGRVAVRVNDDQQWEITSVQATPTLPEEADIGATSHVAVFRASAVVDAQAALAGTGLTVTGKVSDVAFDRFETAAEGALWDVDPHGAGRANATAKVRIVQHTPVRTQTGTTYDFITKRVVPAYDYTEQVSVIGTFTVRAAADGTFRLSRTVSGGNRSYQVYATYVDEAGRSVTAEAYAQTPIAYENNGAWLAAADTADESGEYSIGDAVRVRFMGGVENAPVSRYFYAVTQRGLQYATVGTTPTFRTTFTEASVPNINISAVRFNGYGYDLAVLGWRAAVRQSDRRLTVNVTSDKSRYAPGDSATVSIRTLDPDGKPVSASVFVQVVDEKLYAIGAASQGDPLANLYADVGNGVVAWAASHRTPADDGGDGKGDTTGGGGGDDRSDMRDWLVARLVTTGSDGRASLAVPLSDDLTSWHVSASAMSGALEAGSGTGYLPVGLPFFVEATVAPEYLAVDRPSISVRGFGSGLAAGETVTFVVSSDTLPMSGVTVTAKAFDVAEVALPALSVGTHRIRVAATVGSGSTLRSDALVRTFRVVATRTSRLQTTWSPLDGAANIRAGGGLTQVTLVDAGRGRVVPVLEDLAWTDGGRSDRLLAAALANRVLVDAFGLPAATGTGESDLETFSYEQGLSIVPYGSANLDVTALAAMTGDPRLDGSQLSSALHAVFGDQNAGRDRRLLALAGLAGLGEPVLGDLREAAAQPDLSVEERISVAIGAVYAGDEPLARSIERDLLSAYGQRLGPWVRLDTGDPEDASLLTARLAIVAASLGERVAADMDAWVAENPPRTTTIALERALAAQGWARRVVGSPAVAAVTVDGNRREVKVEPQQPISLQLTPDQAATARLEPVSGSVLVVTTWDAALDSTSLTPATGQKLERTVSPTGAIGPTDTVIVTLRVTLGPESRDECWRVVDLAPSGLAPISVTGWRDDGDHNAWTGTSPDFVDGQRVEFCVVRNPKQAVQALRYVARVVTPGTYVWEPAVLQSTVVPDQGLTIPSTTLTIRGSTGH
jgi:alpha-2-macroglobulin